MSVFKCKMCGGTIEIQNGESVGICEYCGTKQTLPKTDDGVIANLFNRANNLRLKCEFDKAEQIYEKILEHDNTEAEAHWGIILCKYGIEYVEDPKTLERIPTCHRTSYESITASADYLAALEHADFAQREVYEHEAKAIDKIQKNILSIVKNEKPFDVFICYKETDESGKRTVDSAIANDIYYQLTQEGFKVFYSAITLEDKLGQEYEPYIFAALNSAKVMLVIGTNPEYFEAVWVKNEWSRFMKLMKTDRSKLLIPCYKDMDAYDLPEDFAHLQAQDMGKIGFINDIVRGIKKVIVKDEPKVSAPVIEKVSTTSSTEPGTAQLLKRAFMFLEDGEWANADEYCEKVLDLDVENAEAYLGKLMAELRVGKKEDLCNCPETFDDRNSYKKAVRFGNAKLREELEKDNEIIRERNHQKHLENLYNIACRSMDSARTEEDYKNAAKEFENICDFEDAKEKQALCLEKAEEARKDATKKRKTITGIVFAIIAAAAFAAIYVYVIVPAMNYKAALALYDEGKYEEAIVAFEAMGDYKDSAEYAEKAKKAYLDENLSSIEVGNIISLGKYEQDSNLENGAEPIEWQVLDVQNGKALLISKFALESKQYHEIPDEGLYKMSTTWEECSLREWLNNDFLNNSFYEFEKELVLKTDVTVDEYPDGYHIYNTSADNVFILSFDEIKTYLPGPEDRKLIATEYLKEKGIRMSKEGFVEWVTLDVGHYEGNYIAVNVGTDKGYIPYKGVYAITAYGLPLIDVKPFNTYFAVRPAMWIDFAAYE